MVGEVVVAPLMIVLAALVVVAAAVVADAGVSPGTRITVVCFFTNNVENDAKYPVLCQQA